MSIKVNIVPSEIGGWIIGRIINELSLRNGWEVGKYNSKADVNYFINYHAARSLLYSKPSTLTAGWFTHVEHPEFFNIADKIDIKICQAQKYAEAINGVVIPLGVDELFKPKIRLGWVGATYKSGRKGEYLMHGLERLDFVEIVKPNPVGNYFSDKEWLLDLAKFYQTIDALLVTSLVEGGPVPAAEAIASGVQVIAPKVIGNLNDLPVLDYKVGCLDSLIEVVQKLYDAKLKHSASVVEWTWEDFCDRNFEIIERTFYEYAVR